MKTFGVLYKVLQLGLLNFYSMEMLNKQNSIQYSTCSAQYIQPSCINNALPKLPNLFTVPKILFSATACFRCSVSILL